MLNTAISLASIAIILGIIAYLSFGGEGSSGIAWQVWVFLSLTAGFTALVAFVVSLF